MVYQLRTRAGVTLLEVLVVIAIILVLVSVLTPVAQRVKDNSHETNCVSNLRQMWMAISIYRQDWDGIDTPDHPYRMGLPSYAYLTNEIITKNRFKCEGNYRNTEPFYQAFWGNQDLPGFDEYVKVAWLPFAAKFGDKLMLIGDRQHQRGPYSKISRQRYINMSLEGQLQFSYCFGDPADLVNWMKQ